MLVLGLFLIVLAVYAVARGAEVRLVLGLTALVVAVAAGVRAAYLAHAAGAPFVEALDAFAVPPAEIVRTFLETFSNEKYIVPICSAMGFAHVLRNSGCDGHLVRLLVRPLRRVRFLLLPGAVGVGFLVNIPVISQASTAACVGTVLVPLLRAAGFSPVTTGAALLLGASLGGELLNPGAPELQTIGQVLGRPAADAVGSVLPLVLTQLVVATLLFWWLSARAERQTPVAPTAVPDAAEGRVNVVKALVPLLPLALLFLAVLPLGSADKYLPVPRTWLVGPGNPGAFDTRLIGLAMLVGVAAAALANPAAAPRTATAFFEGAGYAFTHIVSVIVVAVCFGKAVDRIGLAELLSQAVGAAPAALLPAAGALPLAFAWVSGSGMAATQSLYGFFTDPALAQGADPVQVGAVVAVAAAAGRTMSPVAAVVLFCGTLTGVNSLHLARRVTVPLLVGTVAVIAVAALLGSRS